MDTDKVEPKAASDFLKRIEENCKNMPDKEAKLIMVRSKVLEKMKRTVRRERRWSECGSVDSFSSRSSGRTRQRSEGDDNVGEQDAKQSRPAQVKSRLPAPSTAL